MTMRPRQGSLGHTCSDTHSVGIFIFPRSITPKGIWNMKIEIWNFNISDEYKQHCLSVFHQLPRCPSEVKKSSKTKKSRKVKKYQPSQEVQARPRSTSHAKKSQPGQEVPSRPRCPIQAKMSHSGQEVLARPRSPSQTEKSQPGQEIPTRPRSSVRPRLPARSRSPPRTRGVKRRGNSTSKWILGNLSMWIIFWWVCSKRDVYLCNIFCVQ